MKKAHYFFIVPIILLGSMNVSAQTETKSSNPQIQLSTPTSLDDARQNYTTALENAKKAATTSRAENAKYQSMIADSKEQFRKALESAISAEANQEKKTALEAELATLISTN
jgi:vacuolar-type H+-ATPase subunit D/Vma8